MLGIKTRWECVKCGNILNVEQPFWLKSHRRKTEEPIKCGCGATTDFRILGLEEIQYKRDDGPDRTYEAGSDVPTEA